MPTETLALSPFQERVLATPETFDVFLGGGRGGGKSYTLALLALRYAEQYQERARILYVRQTYKGLSDFEQITREVFSAAYGRSARFNGTERVWTLPGGGYFELGQLETVADYPKYQGRSFGLLMVDEAGQYPEPGLLDRLRSNLRAPAGIPLRMVVAANPGDPGHQWLASRYVFKATPWAPFLEPKSRRTWIYAPSTYRENRFIDLDGYRGQLESACPADPELLRAWVDGDWTVARGAFFAGVLDEARNAADVWDPESLPRDWRYFLAHDFGVSAPSVTYLCGESPGTKGPDGRFYSRGSILLVDELATNEPDSVTKGMGYVVPVLADEIRTLATRWGVRAMGVADDAIFAHTGGGAGSIAEEFRACGVYFYPARKADRRTGWERLRRMLADAGKPDVPGLYISRRCGYFWATVPYLARDPRKPDDVDTRQADHAADAARYALQRFAGGASVQRMKL